MEWIDYGIAGLIGMITMKAFDLIKLALSKKNGKNNIVMTCPLDRTGTISKIEDIKEDLKDVHDSFIKFEHYQKLISENAEKQTILLTKMLTKIGE